MYFYVSIYSGRIENCVIEAQSKNDILNFYNTFSNSKVLSIKRIVYSVALGINSSGASAPKNLQSKDILKAMVKAKNNVTVLTIRFPKKDLNLKTFEKSLKQNILVLNTKVESLVSCVVK